MLRFRLPAVAAMTLIIPTAAAQVPPDFDRTAAERFAGLALACLHKEYPNKIAHVMTGDADAKPPRLLTPVFFGCYDWHSAVHGHWLLARLVRTWPDAPFAKAARAALGASFTPEKAAAEVAYLAGEGRGPFERPYGLAWLLQLAAELGEWDDPDARRWSAVLRPLEDEAVRRFVAWLPKLSSAVRTGEHSQTAFALGLALDAARSRGHERLAETVAARARRYFFADRGWNLAFEPGGEDFLSPGLAEADLMRRILDRKEFAAWLGDFLPGLGPDAAAATLVPAVVTDKADGKLAHLDGLNLSRAWMLEGIASALVGSDPRLPALRALAARHREAGLAAVTGAHYEGGHWLGSFAVYLVTRRGL